MGISASTWSLIGFVALLVGFATFLGLVLTSLAPFVEESDARQLRSRIEEFWVSLADLTTPEKVGTALKALRRRFRQRIPIFLKLFWFFLFVMFVFVCVENSGDVVHRNLTQAIRGNFDLVDNLYYFEIAKGDKLFCAAHQDICTDGNTDDAWRKEMSRLALLEDSYYDLVEKLSTNNPILLIVIGDLAALLVLIILAIPLSISLLASFNFTLWLLSQVTSSAIRLFIMLILDISVAVLAPLVLLNIGLFIGATLIVFLPGGLWDFSGFKVANLTSLCLGSAAFAIDITFIHQIIPAYFLRAFYSVSILLLAVIYDTIILIMVVIPTRLSSFVSDTWKVIHSDFSTDYLNGAVNWAIIVDMSYSFSLIILAITVVCLRRWSVGRRITLNIVQWFAEHPKGPIFALGQALSGLAAAVAGLWK